MTSAEASILFAKACELFILELIIRLWLHVEENKRRALQKNDIAGGHLQDRHLRLPRRHCAQGGDQGEGRARARGSDGQEWLRSPRCVVLLSAGHGEAGPQWGHDGAAGGGCGGDQSKF
ncbi:hypothetical protein Cni_G04915 [Canna indica]|uniref:Histone H2A/H2B/H3 domain-containing protein n=1 Tax=Canna indica TaxID=4628 RepID=A0AAQ3JVM6_9LILI|nr:hypothetical protein Cni_G04915 [Canna indica]